MGEHGAARVDAPESAEFSKPVVRPIGLPVQKDGQDETRVFELGWSRRLEEAREREEHWEEVELVLELWEKVARSWSNETLLRLARYARLEAETEREIERGAR